MRDKNDLKERLGQKRDKTTHSKSLILKFLSRQSEFTKMHIIQNFSEQKTSPGYTRQDYNKLFFDTCMIKAERKRSTIGRLTGNPLPCTEKMRKIERLM